MTRPIHIHGSHDDIGYPGEFPSDDSSLELRQRLAGFRRQLPVLLVSILIAGFAGATIVFNLPRSYTAKCEVLLDNTRVRAVESDYDNQNSTLDSTASYTESQAEVVKSGQIAEAVIRKMNLLEKPLPVAPSLFSLITWPIQHLMKVIRGAPPPEDPEQFLQSTIAQLQKELDVRHVARTMVLQISYTAASPMLAADIANAYADAYISDKLNAKFEMARRASEWLEARLTELKQKTLDADLAVQKFRAENNLISSGGKLVNEQQITELNTQLVNARSDRARAEARFGRLEQIIASHQTEAVVSDAFGSNIVEALRSKYLAASKREGELLASLGADHASVLATQKEIQEYQRQIFAELSRLEEAYRSEVDIARLKETALTKDIEGLLGEAASQNKLIVILHNFEQQADAFRSLYQIYLQRYQESVHQQSFPIVEARVITRAYEPTAPSHPKKAVLILLFTLLGGVIGVGVAVLREMRESGFSSEEQVRNETRLETLGIVPVMQEASDGGRVSPFPSPPSNEKKPVLGDPTYREVTLLPASRWNYVLTHPNSAMGEAFLAAKLAVDIRCGVSPCKIVGITSAMPGEGKTLAAKNLASQIASRKARVLLIDGDLRRRGLSLELTPQATHGLIEVVTGECDIADVLYSEPQSGLHVLPVFDQHQITHSSDVLASASMRKLIIDLRSRYDYILIDLPPLGPVIDARAMASQLDALLLVIEWRRTPRKLVRNLLRENLGIGEKCIGVILNKVDVESIRDFTEYGSRLYSYEAYAQTYYLDKSRFHERSDNHRKGWYSRRLLRSPFAAGAQANSPPKSYTRIKELLAHLISGKFF